MWKLVRLRDGWDGDSTYKTEFARPLMIKINPQLINMKLTRNKVVFQAREMQREYETHCLVDTKNSNLFIF